MHQKVFQHLLFNRRVPWGQFVRYGSGVPWGQFVRYGSRTQLGPKQVHKSTAFIFSSTPVDKRTFNILHSPVHIPLKKAPAGLFTFPFSSSVSYHKDQPLFNHSSLFRPIPGHQFFRRTGGRRPQCGLRWIQSAPRTVGFSVSIFSA